MPQPESYEPAPSWDQEKNADQKSSRQMGNVVSSENARDVFEVARALAAHGGGTGSFDLALDLVLNDLVEQARLLTGATGAAIALARDGEMVCRATAGADAPDLGTRVETTSGLSGACLQNGKMQQCADTETDPRVDAEACRQLGVRSIMVLPLGDDKNPFGILEVFSSRPYAFSDRDMSSLQVLARRVMENKRGAEDAESELETRIALEEKSSGLPHVQSDVQSEVQDVQKDVQRDVQKDRQRVRTDLWSSLLGVLVIVTAILLVLAVGWRGAFELRLRSEGSKLKSAGSRLGPESQTKRSEAAPSTGSPEPQSSGAAMGPQNTAPVLAEASGGELVVTQNGRVIYRQPAVEESAAAQSNPTPDKASHDDLASRLIHRVQPEYPQAARVRNIQGVVVLDVQVGSDGVVRNIAVVEGDAVLADAAVRAVREWRYRPYSVDGRPVERQARITIRFRLPPN
ncbi:MAG TPA: TonB family protein [Candidatus Sulfotelmatobacter sp.]|jgi:TonB family protein